MKPLIRRQKLKPKLSLSGFAFEDALHGLLQMPPAKKASKPKKAKK
jgi:hypothetical protein